MFRAIRLLPLLLLISAAPDDVQSTYSSLKSLQLTGTVTADFDVAGEKRNFTNSFNSSFMKNVGFRHEMKGDLVVGQSGEKFYSYRPVEKLYSDPANLDEAIGLIWLQNPSLAIALKPELIADAKTIEKGGKSVLEIARTDQPTVDLTFDANTHLVREARIDYSKQLAKLNTPDVTSAIVTIDYTSSEQKTKPEEYAWTPPTGWREATSADVGGDVHELVNKPAPELSLKDLQGKPMILSTLRGSVVVLDFWATWCGPCVAALPHLNAIYAEKKDAGLQVFAVNQGESPDQIKSFLSGKNYVIPVLLDQDSATGAKYKVEGIPQTVIIGKDGNVRKVFVGFDEDGVRAAIDAAMAEK